jgi:small GTP-binding protein
MDYNVKNKHKIKVVLLGNAGVGKTCITNQFVRSEFPVNSESTIGAAFNKLSLVVNNKYFDIEFWDTAGQERYKSLAPMYYRGAHLVIIVYDITDLYSYDCAKNWIKEITNKLPNSCFLLFGNKTDLEDNRKVNTLDNDILFEELNRIVYCREGSAKKNYNIKESIISVLDKIEFDKQFDDYNSDNLKLYNIKLNGESSINNNCCYT